MGACCASNRSALAGSVKDQNGISYEESSDLVLVLLDPKDISNSESSLARRGSSFTIGRDGVPKLKSGNKEYWTPAVFLEGEYEMFLKNLMGNADHFGGGGIGSVSGIGAPRNSLASGMNTRTSVHSLHSGALNTRQSGLHTRGSDLSMHSGQSRNASTTPAEVGKNASLNSNLGRGQIKMRVSLLTDTFRVPKNTVKNNMIDIPLPAAGHAGGSANSSITGSSSGILSPKSGGQSPHSPNSRDNSPSGGSTSVGRVKMIRVTAVREVDVLRQLKPKQVDARLEYNLFNPFDTDWEGNRFLAGKHYRDKNTKTTRRLADELETAPKNRQRYVFIPWTDKDQEREDGEIRSRKVQELADEKEKSKTRQDMKNHEGGGVIGMGIARHNSEVRRRSFSLTDDQAKEQLNALSTGSKSIRDLSIGTQQTMSYQLGTQANAKRSDLMSMAVAKSSEDLDAAEDRLRVTKLNSKDRHSGGSGSQSLARAGSMTLGASKESSGLMGSKGPGGSKGLSGHVRPGQEGDDTFDEELEGRTLMGKMASIKSQRSKDRSVTFSDFPIEGVARSTNREAEHGAGVPSYGSLYRSSSGPPSYGNYNRSGVRSNFPYIPRLSYEANYPPSPSMRPLIDFTEDSLGLDTVESANDSLVNVAVPMGNVEETVDEPNTAAVERSPVILDELKIAHSSDESDRFVTDDDIALEFETRDKNIGGILKTRSSINGSTIEGVHASEENNNQGAAAGTDQAPLEKTVSTTKTAPEEDASRPHLAGSAAITLVKGDLASDPASVASKDGPGGAHNKEDASIHSGGSKERRASSKERLLANNYSLSNNRRNSFQRDVGNRESVNKQEMGIAAPDAMVVAANMVTASTNKFAEADRKGASKERGGNNTEETETYTWRVGIRGPENSAYADGIFLLKFTFSESYPSRSAPQIEFLTPIFHPNINCYSGKVCPIDLLLKGDEWSSAITVEKLCDCFYNLMKAPCAELVNPHAPHKRRTSFAVHGTPGGPGTAGGAAVLAGAAGGQLDRGASGSKEPSPSPSPRPGDAKAEAEGGEKAV